MKGDGELSFKTIQLSSPLPSPSCTPNYRIKDNSLQQPTYHQVCPSHGLSQQATESSNTPILTLDPPRPSSSSSVYPLANTLIPSWLEDIKLDIDNRRSLLDVPPSVEMTRHCQPHDGSDTNQDESTLMQLQVGRHLLTQPHTDSGSPARKKQHTDTTTLDTDHLILKLNDIQAFSFTGADTSSSLATDEMDDPNSALPSPMSDLDPMEVENWVTSSSTGTPSSGVDQLEQGNFSFLSSLLGTYTDLPADIQDYFMYQLLRRSPMSSLRLANDMITQALKTDFITCLTPRLAQQVLLYLDVSSLCRARGVSRGWKRRIEGDSDLWQAKIVEAGFTLTRTEINQYGIGPEYLYHHHHQQQQQQQQQQYDVTDDSESVLASSAPSPAHSYISSSSIRTTSGLVTSPCRSLIKKETALNALDIEYLDQPLRDASLSHASTDTTMFYRQGLAQPDFDTDHDNNNTHPFMTIYKQHYIMRQNWKHNRAKRLQIEGNGAVVTCLQFDDDKIITAFDDTDIKVHDIRSGKLRRVLRGHEGGVWALQYVGNTLVTGSTDRTIRIFDIEQGVCRFVFRGHTSTVRCLQIVMPTWVGGIQPSQPLIVSGSRDKTLRVWKLPYLPDHSQQDMDNGITQEQRTNDDTMNTSSSTDNGYFDSPHHSSHHTHEFGFNPFFIHLLEGHEHSVRALAAHGNCLASASYDKKVILWDLESGKMKHTLIGHSSKVYSVVIDPLRQQCISGSMDSTIRIWNILDGSCKRILKGHTTLVGLLGVSKNHLVSGGADSTLRVWPFDDDDDKKHILVGHKGPITTLHNDDDKVVSGAEGGVKIWNSNTGELMHDLITDVDGVWRVAFDERRCVAAVKSDYTTRIEILDYGTDTEQS
ncbi:hypothetical protein BC941DRAFT_410412 [Chlamydoabsidia padenii]|nr:hypothetical protein BC941DRAFT_410412 [Chlamydoabsidia padenii]